MPRSPMPHSAGLPATEYRIVVAGALDPTWSERASGARAQDRRAFLGRHGIWCRHPNGLELSPAWFGYVGSSHYWNMSLNSTVSTHWTATDLSAFQSDSTIRKAGSVHANLLWFPYRLVSRIEYMWGMRENKDGSKGTASRLQLMVKFKFN